MENELLAWAATPAGIAILAGIIMQVIKPSLGSSLWINLITLLLCVAISAMVAIATQVGTPQELPAIAIVKGILAFGIATGGYEALHNARTKSA